MSSDEVAHNGATSLIDTLLALGVTTVFGYPGGAVLPIYDALVARPALRHILVRHEQAAVHAAQGYARSTGQVGVVFVTSGPGMSNTTTGLLDALCDSVPVVCISGQVASASIGSDAFQECDALGISRPVTKWNAQARDSGEIERLVRRAFAIASGPRPGPVLLDIPKDVQLQALPNCAQRGVRSNAPACLEKRSTSNLPHGHLTKAVAMIHEARQPIIYGGGGLINSGQEACNLFGKLVDRIAAPCSLTLMGLGAIRRRDRTGSACWGCTGRSRQTSPCTTPT